MSYELSHKVIELLQEARDIIVEGNKVSSISFENADEDDFYDFEVAGKISEIIREIEHFLIETTKNRGRDE